MARRETVESLRLYFFLVGAIQVVNGVIGVATWRLAEAKALAAAGVLLGGGLVYGAIFFAKHIKSAPWVLQSIALAQVPLMLVYIYLGASGGNPTRALANAAGILIVGFVVVNIRRLASQPAPTAAPPVEPLAGPSALTEPAHPADSAHGG